MSTANAKRPMKWNRLKDMECPSCGSAINKPVLSVYPYSCQNFMCDFTISKHRFDEVVESLYKKKGVGETSDNQESLNNL